MPSAREQLEAIILFSEEQRPNTVKNLTIAGLGGGALIAGGLLTHRGIKTIKRVGEDVSKSLSRTRAAVDEVGIPAIHEIVNEHLRPAASEARKAMENVKYATTWSGDVGRIYSGAKGGIGSITHPSKTLREIKEGYHAGRSLPPEDPEGIFVRAGRTARKLVKGFSAREQLNLITFGQPEIHHPHSVAHKDHRAGLLSIINMGSDPRPRNPLGEFSGDDDGVPSAHAMKVTYGMGPTIAGGAAAGVTGAGATVGLKALIETLKARK